MSRRDLRRRLVGLILLGLVPLLPACDEPTEGPEDGRRKFCALGSLDVRADWDLLLWEIEGTCGPLLGHSTEAAIPLDTDLVQILVTGSGPDGCSWSWGMSPDRCERHVEMTCVRTSPDRSLKIVGDASQVSEILVEGTFSFERLDHDAGLCDSVYRFEWRRAEP